MSIITDDSNFEKNFDINKKNQNVKAETIEFDKNFENSIRPKSFESYIGHKTISIS